MASSDPSDPFWRNQQRLAIARDRSAYCDSRISRWCYHTGRDPALCRAALAAGYTVRFTDARRGRSILLHIVHPDEVE